MTLVCESDVPLVEVAWRVGFEDQSHFTRMFRRVGGVTPGRLRRTAVRTGSDRGAATARFGETGLAS